MMEFKAENDGATEAVQRDEEYKYSSSVVGGIEECLTLKDLH